MRAFGIILILAAAIAGCVGIYLFKAPLEERVAYYDSYAKWEVKSWEKDREETRNIIFGAAGIGALLGFMFIAISPKPSTPSQK